MARRGRPKKSKPTKCKTPTFEELVQAELDKKNAPNRKVCERRVMFAPLVRAEAKKRQDGRNGEIDSEVCDAIGQLCALGLLDGHGYDPVELRDKGRFWGCHYAKLMKGSGVKCGSYERKDRSEPTGALTGEDLLFDRMDEALPRYERMVLMSLVVDPLIGHLETVPWAQALIDEALLGRGRVTRAMMFPTLCDREYLKAAIRALCSLVEGALPGRYERRAA